MPLAPSLGEIVLGTQSNAVLTIRENDSGLGFAPSGYRVNETNDEVLITVRLESDSPGPFTVDYAATNFFVERARPGVDYMPVSGTLSFAVGETSKTFTVPILDDPLVDGERYVDLALSAGLLKSLTVSCLEVSPGSIPTARST